MFTDIIIKFRYKDIKKGHMLRLPLRVILMMTASLIVETFNQNEKSLFCIF